MGNQEAFELASRYLAFIWYAYNAETGRFRNFMTYQRTWLETKGSDDSHGRALWALGTVLGRSHTRALQSMAGWLFEQALPAILDTTSPRAWAFALIGIHEYVRRFAGDRRASQVQEELSRRLLSLYQRCRSDDWRWYEEGLTYCNAVLPHASLICGQSVQSAAMIEAGLESLDMAGQNPTGQRRGGILSPSDPTASTEKAVNAPVSINSRWRVRRWCPPVSKLIESRRTTAGAKKPNALLSGFSDATI